jgi:hypothetical protein
MSRRASREARAAERHREQVARAIAEADPSAAAIRFTVGDIVESVSFDWVLHSGSGRYADAVVVSVAPFALASREADMLWTATVEPKGFRVVVSADAETIERTARRMPHGGSTVHFNVAKAREYGEWLVAMAEAYEVFTMWAEDFGHGLATWRCLDCIANPGWSNDIASADGRLHRVPCPTCNGSERSDRPSGGWPSFAARKFGTIPCEACDGRGRIERLTVASEGSTVDLGNGTASRSYNARRTFERCKPCKGRGHRPKPGYPRSAANGLALARLGRRLLAAIEGQPSGCQGCGGSGLGFYEDSRRHAREECPDCHGTGHNLHGVLPPAQDSEQAVVKAADAFRTASRDSRGRSELVAAWQGEVINRDRRRINLAMSKPTRVVPRGEHRNEQRMLGAWLPGRNVAHRLRPNLDGRIESRMSLNGFRNDFCDHAKLPRWRRGEIKHAEQRRARGVVLSRETTPFVDDDGNPNAITMTVRLSPSPEPAA